MIEKIAPGNLMMRYTQGKEWDPVSKMFQRDRANFESDQIFKFEEMETETKTSDGIVKEKRYSAQKFYTQSIYGRRKYNHLYKLMIRNLGISK